MNQPAKAQEPSMEEILASIRRIIADDDAAKTAPPPPPPAADPMPPPPTPMPARPVAAPAPRPPAPPPPQRPAAAAPRPAPMVQDEIDALMAPERQGSGVLDLTEAMTAAPAPAPRNEGFRTIDGQSDIMFEEAPAEPEPPPPPVEPRRHAADNRGGAPDPRPLISSHTTAAVDSAFNSLAQTVFVQNAQTLEDLVREMLRPLLKTWLDDNLPGLVERLVRAEIERVSRGRK